MNFNFIPYRLNVCISELKGDIEYIDTDNGIDLYRVKESKQLSMLEVPVKVVNLYAFQERLITIYLHIDRSQHSTVQIIELLNKTVTTIPTQLKTEKGVVYIWQNVTEVLGLISESNKLCLYYSLKVYSIF